MQNANCVASHASASRNIARWTAGAARIRHSLRPLFLKGEEFQARLGRITPRDREVVSAGLFEN
jgi:hypothetical protein